MDDVKFNQETKNLQAILGDLVKWVGVDRQNQLVVYQTRYINARRNQFKTARELARKVVEVLAAAGISVKLVKTQTESLPKSHARFPGLRGVSGNWQLTLSR